MDISEFTSPERTIWAKVNIFNICVLILIFHRNGNKGFAKDSLFLVETGILYLHFFQPKPISLFSYSIPGLRSLPGVRNSQQYRPTLKEVNI
jgi:hypothetical protein